LTIDYSELPPAPALNSETALWLERLLKPVRTNN